MPYSQWRMAQKVLYVIVNNYTDAIMKLGNERLRQCTPSAWLVPNNSLSHAMRIKLYSMRHRIASNRGMVLYFCSYSWNVQGGMLLQYCKGTGTTDIGDSGHDYVCRENTQERYLCIRFMILSTEGRYEWSYIRIKLCLNTTSCYFAMKELIKSKTVNLCQNCQITTNISK